MPVRKPTGSRGRRTYRTVAQGHRFSFHLYVSPSRIKEKSEIISDGEVRGRESGVGEDKENAREREGGREKQRQRERVRGKGERGGETEKAREKERE